MLPRERTTIRLCCPCACRRLFMLYAARVHTFIRVCCPRAQFWPFTLPECMLLFVDTARVRGSLIYAARVHAVTCLRAKPEVGISQSTPAHSVETRHGAAGRGFTRSLPHTRS